MKLTEEKYKITFVDRDFKSFAIQNKKNGRHFDIYFSALEFDARLEKDGYDDVEYETGYIQIATIGMFRYVEVGDSYEEKPYKVTADEYFIEYLAREIGEIYDWDGHAQAEYDYFMELQKGEA